MGIPRATRRWSSISPLTASVPPFQGLPEVFDFSDRARNEAVQDALGGSPPGREVFVFVHVADELGGLPGQGDLVVASSASTAPCKRARRGSVKRSCPHRRIVWSRAKGPLGGHGYLLDPAADFINSLGSQLHDVERVHDDCDRVARVGRRSRSCTHETGPTSQPGHRHESPVHALLVTLRTRPRTGWAPGPTTGPWCAP